MNTYRFPDSKDIRTHPQNLLYYKDMSYASAENAEEEACEKEETL